MSILDSIERAVRIAETAAGRINPTKEALEAANDMKPRLESLRRMSEPLIILPNASVPPQTPPPKIISY